MSRDVLSPYANDNMSTQKKNQPKTLKNACWQAGYSITEISKALGMTRFTAYRAWKNPELFPFAAPKLFDFLGHERN